MRNAGLEEAQAGSRLPGEILCSSFSLIFHTKDKISFSIHLFAIYSSQISKTDVYGGLRYIFKSENLSKTLKRALEKIRT